METDGRGARKSARERAETRERRRRVALLVAADRVGDERVDVVRIELERVRERTPRRDGPAEPLQRDPVQEAAAHALVGTEGIELRGRRVPLDPIREARREDRQARRELGVDEVVRADGVRRVRLDVARLAPGGERTAGARPEAGQADVELDERAAGIERAELLDPIFSGRPRGERRAELRLERVVTREDAAGLVAAALLVEGRGAPQVARLGVVADPERERERRKPLPRLRLGRRGQRLVGIVGRQHGRTGDHDRRQRGERSHDESGAATGRHAANLATPRLKIFAGRSTAHVSFAREMATYRELLAGVKAEIDELGAAEARERQGSALFVDVREREEWDEGIVPGALHIPRGNLESRIEGLVPDREREIVVYCSGGSRSAFAAKALQELGYENVTSLTGGFTDWKRNGFPVEVPRALTPDQRRRYSRHLLIPEVGEAGQERLLAGRVLLIGAGGLGSPAALYLAAAGVGTIGIVDADVVDDSNLQRQIVHATDRLGEPKVDSAKRTIQALNPDVDVKTYEERLTSENADRILEDGWDVIVDGADNFPTRYLVNDASIWHGIPVVHGSIYRFEGQVTVFNPGEGPCYRCLFPTPPPPELAPSCAEGGVLGVLPGIVGSLQANEALKLVLGIGDTLEGRLLLLDALGTTVDEVAVKRDPTCPVCGEHPTITEYIDYVEFCQGVRL